MRKLPPEPKRKEKSEAFLPIGAVVLDDRDIKLANKLLSDKQAHKIVFDWISEALSREQEEWWELWAQFKTTYNFPQEQDGYRVWYDPHQKSICWRRKE